MPVSLKVIYDLLSRGHHTLIADPQIARAMRKTKGSWVTLKEASSPNRSSRRDEGRTYTAGPNT